MPGEQALQKAARAYDNAIGISWRRVDEAGGLAATKWARGFVAGRVAAMRAALAEIDAALAGTGDECTCPEHGTWRSAADIDRLVKELDTALNGPGGATNPRLCDVVGQVRDQHWRLVRSTPHPPEGEGREEPIIPHDIDLGGIRFRAGVKLSVFVNAAQRWYDKAKAASEAGLSARREEPALLKWDTYVDADGAVQVVVESGVDVEGRTTPSVEPVLGEVSRDELIQVVQGAEPRLFQPMHIDQIDAGIIVDALLSRLQAGGGR